MGLLGKDPLGCKTFMDNKSLQHVKNLEYVGCEISCENKKDIRQQLAKFSQIPGILNNTFKPNLVQKFLSIKYMMYWPSPFFYMEVKSVPLEKR